MDGKTTRNGRGSPSFRGWEDQSLEACRSNSDGLVDTWSSQRKLTESVHDASRFALERLCLGDGASDRGVVDVSCSLLHMYST